MNRPGPDTRPLSGNVTLDGRETTGPIEIVDREYKRWHGEGNVRASARIRARGHGTRQTSWNGQRFTRSPKDERDGSRQVTLNRETGDLGDGIRRLGFYVSFRIHHKDRMESSCISNQKPLSARVAASPCRIVVNRTPCPLLLSELDSELTLAKVHKARQHQ